MDPAKYIDWGLKDEAPLKTHQFQDLSGAHIDEGERQLRPQPRC